MNNIRSEENRPMRSLWNYLNNYKKDLWLASTASVINKLFDLMPPVLTAWFIDSVSGNTPAWIHNGLGISEVVSVVIFLTVLTFVVFLLESFFEWLFKRGFMRLAQKMQHDLRVKTYSQIQQREMAFFENQRTGNLLSILNDDVNQLERFLNDSFNTILQLIVLVLFAGTALLVVSLPLGLLALLPIPFIIWGSMVYQRKVSPHYKNVREKVGALSSRLENNISGIQVIKSFTAEEFELQRVDAASAEYREANFKAIRWNAVYVPLIRMVIAIGFVGTLAMGAWWVYQGVGGITLGSLALFAMMSQRLLWPITQLGFVFNEYERAKAASARIFKILNSKNLLKDSSKEMRSNPLNGNIEFININFSYPQGPPILQNINLRIPQGKTLGVVGLTGAGKTTLIKLLLRFYDLSDGDILLDEQSILNYSPQYLRNQMALVSQEVYLFHGSIRENMCYGRMDISEEKMVEASRKASLHEYIMSLPQGYDSIIGERGIKLSGGQRQRLSFARAILKDAPILILDEATSAIDTLTEKLIQQNLQELIQHKTAIIIAHRLSTVRNADNIVVIGDGKIVEQGKHSELLTMRGVYHELWNVQTGEIPFVD